MLVLGLVNDHLTRPALAEAQKPSATAFQSADSAVRNAAVVESMGMRQSILRRYHAANEKVLDLQGRASDRAAIQLSEVADVMAQNTGALNDATDHAATEVTELRSILS